MLVKARRHEKAVGRLGKVRKISDVFDEENDESSRYGEDAAGDYFLCFDRICMLQVFAAGCFVVIGGDRIRFGPRSRCEKQ